MAVPGRGNPRDGNGGDERLVFRLHGRIAREDIATLCRLLHQSLTGNPGAVVVCDVRGLVEPCLAAVDALAALQLTAKETGHTIRLRDPRDELLELLDLAGLSRAFLLDDQPE